MKLPDSTKKQETRATLNTIKIMSLIKREMKFQDIRFGKIGDHICTNRRIKLRENRRNIELFTNKQNIVATFIHVGNDKGLFKTL
jgi:DNA-directed RNA polymerase delta subunit